MQLLAQPLLDIVQRGSRHHKRWRQRHILPKHPGSHWLRSGWDRRRRSAQPLVCPLKGRGCSFRMRFLPIQVHWVLPALLIRQMFLGAVQAPHRSKRSRQKHLWIVPNAARHKSQEAVPICQNKKSQRHLSVQRCQIAHSLAQAMCDSLQTIPDHRQDPLSDLR